MIVNFNGRFVAPAEACLCVNDGAFLFGDTLFETIKARGRTIRFLEDHLDRIELASRMLAFPFSRKQTEQALMATAERLESPVSRLRLTVSRGAFAGLAFPSPQQGNFVVSAVPYSEPTDEERAEGVACVFAPNQRVNPLSHLPQIKRGNCADCLYAANHARSKGAREALFATTEGLVLEGATSNLFMVHSGILITPPAGKQVLAGIMRRKVLEAAKAEGIRTEERSVPVAAIYEADEAFITNALIDLLPAASLEGRAIPRGPLTGILRRAIERLEGR
jgi:branched-subunit amino acid aminotransferase/4-amino-4-deoxychorismate lyase